jgi:REP element-mobilizing transposase RayT
MKKSSKKICDLPIWYVLRATKNQKAQGNPANMYLDMDKTASKGNFNWDKTFEGNEFWSNAYYGKILNEEECEKITAGPFDFPTIEDDISTSLEDVMNELNNL